MLQIQAGMRELEENLNARIITVKGMDEVYKVCFPAFERKHLLLSSASLALASQASCQHDIIKRHAAARQTSRDCLQVVPVPAKNECWYVAPQLRQLPALQGFLTRMLWSQVRRTSFGFRHHVE